MASFSYPAGLPGPESASLSSTERRLVQGQGAPFAPRHVQRDHQYRQDVVFFFTAEEAEVFQTWWRDDLILGGAWFAAAWPHPEGEIIAVRHFVTKPRWQLVGTSWRVSATCEVRGYSELPVEPNGIGYGGTGLVYAPQYLAFLEGRTETPVLYELGGAWDPELTASSAGLAANGLRLSLDGMGTALGTLDMPVPSEGSGVAFELRLTTLAPELAVGVYSALDALAPYNKDLYLGGGAANFLWVYASSGLFGPVSGGIAALIEQDIVGFLLSLDATSATGYGLDLFVNGIWVHGREVPTAAFPLRPMITWVAEGAERVGVGSAAGTSTAAAVEAASGGGAVLLDTFTGTAGTLLGDHNGESGYWTPLVPADDVALTALELDGSGNLVQIGSYAAGMGSSYMVHALPPMMGFYMRGFAQLDDTGGTDGTELMLLATDADATFSEYVMLLVDNYTAGVATVYVWVDSPFAPSGLEEIIYTFAGLGAVHEYGVSVAPNGTTISLHIDGVVVDTVEMSGQMSGTMLDRYGFLFWADEPGIAKLDSIEVMELT